MTGQQQNKYTLVLADVVKHLQKECVAAPINYRKIVRTYKDDVHAMHQALTFLHQGLLDNYHMLPRNGRMSF
jgi:hypothetical protein